MDERNESKKLTDSRREVGKSIQMIHRYRDNMLAKVKNPVENGILEIDPAKAVKVTIRRPIPSGALGETDVYGAQQHAPLMGLEIEF